VIGVGGMAWCASLLSTMLICGADAVRARSKRHSSLIHTASVPGAEFRGTFRDLELWVDKPKGPRPLGVNESLWVIEYPTAEAMAAERRRAELGGLVVTLQEKLSLVVEGNVPAVMGYDACGSETDKTVLSVPNYEVSERPMPAGTAQQALQRARTADPSIQALLNAVSRDRITTTLDKLQSYTSRRSESGSAGLTPAADWIAGQLAGYGFQVSRDSFRSDYTPQIVAELVGEVEPEKVVVYGAHLDSTAGWGSGATSRSPGADDNGSGSSAVLEFAKIVNMLGLRFKHTIRLCLFTGEEQGLIGSRALARRWSQEGVNVIAMFNTDMIGYRQPGTPIQINLMNRRGDANLLNIARQVTNTYLPGIPNGNTSACCSDQQSFVENGFPAAGYFETPGSSVYYPQYHRSTDLLRYLDPEQIATQAKAAFAATAVMAEVMSSSPSPTPPSPTPPSPTPPSPTPPSPTPPSPTPPSPPPPSPTPPNGGCEHEKDCNVNPWCRNTGYEEWCRQQGQFGACPAPYCKQT